MTETLLHEGFAEASSPGRAPALAISQMIVALVFALALAQFAFYAGWMLRQPILDLWGFRPAQTAIAVPYMLKEGAWLDTIVPVFGEPWIILLELPVYQWAAALLAWLSGLSVGVSARLVSAAVSVLCLWPIYLTAKASRIENATRLTLMTGALWLLSPVVVFWGRATLIETTIVFLSLMWLAFYVRFLNERGLLDLALCILFGTLAAMVKLTAFAGFLLAGVFFTLSYMWRARRELKEHILHLALCLAAVLVAIGALFVWIWYTSALLARNPLSNMVTVSSISGWYLGSLSERLSARLWDWTIRRRALPNMLGPLWPLLALIVIPLAVRCRMLLAVLCLCLCFLAGYLLFPVLFIANIYYEVENVIFLCAAIALVTEGLLRTRHPLLALLVFLPAVVGQGLGLHRGFYAPYLTFDLHDHPYYKAALAVRDATPPDTVVVGFGMGWGADLPYYAERRGLIIPNWAAEGTLNEMLFQDRRRWLGGRAIGAVVDCTVFAVQDIAPNLVPLRDRLVAEMSGSVAELRGSVAPGPKQPMCKVYLAMQSLAR